MNRKAVQRIMSAMGWILPVQRGKGHLPTLNASGSFTQFLTSCWRLMSHYMVCGNDRWGYLFNHLDVFSRQWLAYIFSGNMRKRNAIDSPLKAVDSRDTLSRSTER